MTIYPHSVQIDESTTTPLKAARTTAIALVKDGPTLDDVASVLAVVEKAKADFPSVAIYDDAIAQVNFVAEQVGPKTALSMLAGYLIYIELDPSPKKWTDYFVEGNQVQHELHVQLAKRV